MLRGDASVLNYLLLKLVSSRKYPLYLMFEISQFSLTKKQPSPVPYSR